MTAITGDPYFPGGMGRFEAPKNNFLVFEKGPSVDVELQWATYADSADECSLSRIYGGIHPSFDDIPGRMMGAEVAKLAFAKASTLWDPVNWWEDPAQLAGFIIIVGLAGIAFIVGAGFASVHIYKRIKRTRQGWNAQVDEVPMMVTSTAVSAQIDNDEERTADHDPELE